MRHRLNIPLKTTTTRRRNWRVVWLILTFILTMALYWLSLQALLAIDTTSTLRPNDAKWTIHIQLTPKNRQILENRMGPKQLIQGLPWTWHDALKWSNNEMSIHIGEQGIIAVSSDKILPKKVQLSINAFQTHIIMDKNGEPKGISSISTDKITQVRKFHPSLIFFRRDGLIIWQDETKNPLTIEKNRIIAHGMGLPSSIHTVSLAENAEILAQLHFLRPVVASIFTESSQLNLFQALSDSDDIFLTLSQDKFGLAYNLLFQGSQATLDELTTIGNELMQINNLSTTSWTIQDGTRISEIISNKDDVKSGLVSENGINTLQFSSLSDNQLRIIQSNDAISLSNRKTSLNTEENTYKSTCARTNQFLKLENLLKIYAAYGSSPVVDLPLPFNEIAFKKNKTFFCWE